MTVFVGDDWAEAHHDVHLMNESGDKLVAERLPEGLDGIAALHAMVAEHAADPSEVVVGIETERGLWVQALIAAGLSGVRDQSVVGVALSGPPQRRWREVRPGRRQGAGRSGPH